MFFRCALENQSHYFEFYSETVSLESEIVRVVSLRITEIYAITRLKSEPQGPYTLQEV